MAERAAAAGPRVSEGRKTPEAPARAWPLPHLAPMLATPAAGLPREPQAFAYELKWDGIRALAYIDRGSAELLSRNDLPMRHRYPELGPLWKALARRRAILDGEIVALDAENRPSFALLQQRMHVEDAASIARLAAKLPAFYLIFDLLYLDGTELLQQNYDARRRRLAQVLPPGEAWRISPAAEDGEALLNAARAQRLEGVVAKRRSSPYQPGRRSLDWLKIKLLASQEFVVGGWVPELGTNQARVGALLLGYYDRQAKLRYAGRVGTGFNQAWHHRLSQRLGKLRAEHPAFDEKLDGREAIFVRPELVAEVEYRRWPEGAKVQQAAFKGLREDKAPGEVGDERARGQKSGKAWK